MAYGAARLIFHDGDVLLVSGMGPVSVFLRVATGSDFSHVGMLIQFEGGWWVAEMKEGEGFQMVPASQWVHGYLKGKAMVWHGEAPAAIRGAIQIHEAALRMRAKDEKKPVRYGWTSLPLVWISHLLGRRIPTATKVCSTFVGACWAAAGFRWSKTPTPGVVARECSRMTRLCKDFNQNMEDAA
jgi:hypothetical protein